VYLLDVVGLLYSMTHAVINYNVMNYNVMLRCFYYSSIQMNVNLD